MSDNTNAPSALPKNCAHCARIKSAEWHLVCDDCWPLIPEHIRNELIAAHAERVGSDRHLVAIEFALHSLAKAIPKSRIDPITGLVHVCTVRSDDGWEAMCCLWDGARWLYWDNELEPHGWEPVTDMNCVVEDWDLPVMPGSPCYRAPAPVAPDVPKDAEARAISAFNLKAADLCMPFRIRNDDGRQAMRAALAAYAPVAPGGVITEEQVERACEAYDPMWNCRLMVERQTIKERMRTALLAAMGGRERDFTSERLRIAVEALERLSRLGNEPHLGNSDGNCIAIDALEKIGPLPPPPTTPSTSEGE